MSYRRQLGLKCVPALQNTHIGDSRGIYISVYSHFVLHLW